MRFNTKTNSLVWISEGAQWSLNISVLQDPAIQSTDLTEILSMNSICQAT
jgi:hypothetical protein